MLNIQNIGTLKELDNLMNKETIIIYGVGKVTAVLLNYFFQRNLLDEIFCIAVYNERNNPDEMRGIPVCGLDDLVEYKDSAEILVAALEGQQGDAALELNKRGFLRAYVIGNLLYAKLRKMETSYDTDIWQMLEVWEKKQRILFHAIQRIENILLHDRENAGNDKDLLYIMYGQELKAWYIRNTGKILNLDHPRSFNEKIQWLKLFDTTKLKTDLSDKYTVREYVRKRIGEQYLIPMYGVWNDFTQIDFSELPDQFVLKCNHGSGWNAIVRDKKAIDYKKMCSKFNGWLATNYAFQAGFEMQYMDIKPRIIAEEYIAEMDGEIYDYRFYCFNGTPVYVWVDKGSGTSNHQRTIYDIDWKQQDYKVSYPYIVPAPVKPDNYDGMVECAKRLCESFIFVRVDLYSIEGKIYFGEMTFTPQSGIGKWENDEIDRHYGDLIRLPIDNDNF